MCLCRWYRSSPATSHYQKRMDAIRNIRYYYSHVVNGVSAAFVIVISSVIVLLRLLKLHDKSSQIGAKAMTVICDNSFVNYSSR